MKIAFTTELPLVGFQRLEDHTLNTPLHEADILVSTFDKPVTRAMLLSAPNLRLVANFGAGYNNIDLDTCRERGIRVTNTPMPVVEPTAELAFSLMHAVARRTAELDRHLRRQNEPTYKPRIQWGVMENLSHSLYGKTLGIIGMGHIGQALARRAVAAGMSVIYHNRKPVDIHHLQMADNLSDTAKRMQQTAVESAKYVSMDELLEQADFVSLNLPYTPEVHHLINADAFGKMKKTAYFINTARGAHVDEQALVKALQQGQIAGAALDVYEHEPHITDELLLTDNVVLSPHTGTGTWEGRIEMCENVCDNILAFVRGETDKMNIVL